MPAQLKETLSSIIGELKVIASTKTVVGEPLTLDNKMVVPVSRIMVGFGVGGGEGQEAEKRGGFAGGRPRMRFTTVCLFPTLRLPDAFLLL